MIVNVTDPKLDLEQGVVSRALLNKGGQSIQDDLTAKFRNGIKEGDIAESVSGDLNCIAVFHITMTKKKHGGDKV